MDNTAEAVARGVFGSPSFFVGDELYFGKDRLRDVEEEMPAGLTRLSSAARIGQRRPCARLIAESATPYSRPNAPFMRFARGFTPSSATQASCKDKPVMRLLSDLLCRACALSGHFCPAAARPMPRQPCSATFKDWSAYTTGTGERKVCYALSKPVASDRRSIKRDPIYFLINDWPGRKAKAEPEIVPGYTVQGRQRTSPSRSAPTSSTSSPRTTASAGGAG